MALTCLALLVVGASGGPGEGAPAPTAWGPVASSRPASSGAASVPTASVLTGSGAPGVLALPGGVVWAYDGAQVFRSTDAGAHWRAVLPTWPQAPTALQVTGAFFLTANVAWAVTDHLWPAPPGVTTTWETTDGGARWHQGTSLPGALTDYGPPFDQLVFGDAAHGYAFGENGSGTGPEGARRGVLWTTSDGGRDWAQLHAVGLAWPGGEASVNYGAGCSQQDPFTLTAASAHVLVLAASLCPTRAPGVWRSDDGGRNWSPVRLPAPPGGWPASEAWDYPSSHQPLGGAEVLATRFFAGAAGVMAFTTRPGELLVYRSNNAGASWVLASTLQTGSLSRPAGFDASSPTGWELPAPAGLYLSGDAGQQWRLQRSALSLADMAEVSFASGEMGVGFANNNPANGLLTLDGGRTWRAVPLAVAGAGAGVPAYSMVDFVTPSDGWVAGADGVEATTDGGGTWRPQLATPAPVEELSFSGAEHGWALTADQLFATSDGGRHWSARPETSLGAFTSVQLVTPSFGVASVCGQGATRALATSDGGLTWRPVPVPGPNDLGCGGPAPTPGTFYGLCFGTPQVGWALLRRPGDVKAALEHSTDGGRHWALVASFAPAPSQLACQGPAQLWAGFDWQLNMGYAGDLAATMDGGKTWRMAKVTGPAALYAPRLTAADGTAVGALGTAGGTAALGWQPVEALDVSGPGDVVDLWDDGGACTIGFGLLTTADGGATWSSAPGPGTSGDGQCHSAGLPFLGTYPTAVPSVSFPDAEDGFVLAPAGAQPAPKGGSPGVTMALIGTTDTGQSWHLVARFAWTGH